MAIHRSTEPITASDGTLVAVLADGHLPTLLPALAQATRDPSLLRDDLRPTMSSPPLPQGGLTPDQQAAARALALGALKTLRERGEVAGQIPETDLRRTLEWMTGSADVEEYLPLVLEELAPADDDPRAPSWRKDPDVDFTVAIIGAGMSGIVAAVRLKQAGIPFVILEKNADVGGTWFENTYPGARVDVSNAFYSYSFAQRTDWPKHYSTQQILLDYFRECADEYGLGPHIRFSTEVTRAEFVEGSATWRLSLRTPDGEDALEVQALISAVGQLNRPKLPDIPGRDRFAGPSFHSARWDHEVDLKGKRVAVIGTGASAAQFIPAIAPDVTHLTVFQRTPNWFAAVPQYHDDVPEGQQWLFRHVPHYAHWYRFWLFWATVEGLLPAVRVDPEWQPSDRSISGRNDQLRMLMTGYIERQFADRPDLLAKVVPQYPPGAKRIVLDNGSWATALKRDNVDLVTEPIEEITAHGVRTRDGAEHHAHVLIYGTGFNASRFLMPMKVIGRGGADLHEQWGGDARAYLGITIPNFPNLFLMYSPNTNIVVNGSIIYFSECEVRYILGCLRLLIEGEHHTMECRSDVHDAFNVRIDEANRCMAWGAAEVNTWYRNDLGRVAQNWPFNLLDYWRETREPNPEDFVVA